MFLKILPVKFSLLALSIKKFGVFFSPSGKNEINLYNRPYNLKSAGR